MDRVTEIERLLKENKYTQVERDSIILATCKEYNVIYSHITGEFVKPYNPIFGGCY